MPVPVRSIRLQKRSSQSLDTLSGASGEIFFDADRGTLRLYTANQADNITLADRAWVTANTFSGNYTDLAGIPTLVYDYNELNNVPVLATVATTGNYNDLLNLPADLSSIDGIGDVDTTTDPLSTGQLLQWSGISWVNATIDGAQDTTYSLTIAGSAVNADLTLTPDTGLAETIEFVGGTGIDVGINLSGQVEVLNTATYAINDLSDVNISNPALNEVLAYDGAQWISSTPSTGIALTDISVGAAEAPSGDGAIAYDNTTGVFTYTPPAGGADFSTITITTEAAQGGGTLSFDGVNEFTFRPANLSNALAQLADDSSPELGGNLDLLAFQIESSSGNAVITSSTADTQINAPSGTVRLTGQTVAANALGGNINLTGDTGNLAITNTAALANIVLTSENTIDSVISSSTILSVGASGATVVGDISADTFSLATPGTPVITSASTITLTAPDGVISNGVFAPMYTGLVKGSSGTVTVIGQGVSTTSVADNSLGDYTLTFSSPLAADTDSFGLIGSVQNQSISATVSFVKTSTTVIQIYVHDASGTNIDADVFLTIYEI